MPTPEPPSDRMSFKIDGLEFEALVVGGLVRNGTLGITGNESADPDSRWIGLTLPPEIAVGTYDITSSGESDISALFDMGSVQVLFSRVGTLTISEHRLEDKFIEGTFTFRASEPGETKLTNFTDGFFSLTYEQF